MKVQRLIEKYKKLEGVWDAPGAETARQIFLQDLKQLDEPQKVKVSEEEAKFLKTFNFRYDSDVTKALYYVSRTGFCYYLTDNFDTELKGLSEGFHDLENRKRLIRAILFGYEVEEEPKYTVKIKATKHYFAKDGNGRIYFSLKYESAFTKIELEKVNLGWVFDCEGVEVEEVTE
jgi:hypothetical protein